MYLRAREEYEPNSDDEEEFGSDIEDDDFFVVRCPMCRWVPRGSADYGSSLCSKSFDRDLIEHPKANVALDVRVSTAQWPCLSSFDEQREQRSLKRKREEPVTLVHPVEQMNRWPRHLSIFPACSSTSCTGATLARHGRSQHDARRYDDR